LKPSKSASNAGNPRSFHALQTVDFPGPEIPLTQMSGIFSDDGRLVRHDQEITDNSGPETILILGH
jgi:hypothetical protein